MRTIVLRNRTINIPETVQEQRALYDMAKATVKLDKFTGIDAEDWLEKFANACQINGWDTDEDQIAVFPTLLAGDAAQWYKVITTFRASAPAKKWENWIPVIKEAFTGDITDRHLALERRTFLPDEKPERYYYDVLDLCNKLDPTMTDEIKLHHLKRGLPKSLARNFLGIPLAVPKDFKNVLQKLVSEANDLNVATPSPETQALTEAFQNLLRSAYNSRDAQRTPTNFAHPRGPFGPPPSENGQNNYYDRNRSWNPSSAGRWQSQDRRTNTGGPICYICRKRGHIQRYCPENDRNRSGNGRGPAPGRTT